VADGGNMAMMDPRNFLSQTGLSDIAVQTERPSYR
jgi:hypothetical protein